MTKREKDLTVQLLVEKLQRISGKKVVLKEDVASGVDNPEVTTDKNGEAKLNVTEDVEKGIDLYGVADEIIENDLLDGYTDMESEGNDVLRMDYQNGNNSIWLYANGGTDGVTNTRLKEFLKTKGFNK